MEYSRLCFCFCYCVVLIVLRYVGVDGYVVCGYSCTTQEEVFYIFYILPGKTL